VATSGRWRRWGTVALAAVGVSLFGCTPAPDPATGRASAGDIFTSDPVNNGATVSGIALPAATYGGVALGSVPCHVALPDGWRRAVEAGHLWSGRLNSAPGAPMPDGSGVLVASDLGVVPTRITVQGAGQQVVQDFGTVDNPTGQGQWSYSSADADHVVFAYEFTIGEQQSDRWAIYVGDRRTMRLTEIARNPVDSDGVALPSVWVRPVLTRDYVYWIQATRDKTPWGGNELMQYSFATGSTRVIYHGMALGFVPLGSMIVFGALAPDAPPPPTDGGLWVFPEIVEAVDQATGLPVEPPAGLDFAQDNPDSVISDGDIVVWSTPKMELRAWRAAWGRSITLVPRIWWPEQKLGVNAVDDPQIYGHFLSWRGGWVLDLTTNTFASLTTANGSDCVSGSGDWLAWCDLDPGSSNPAPPGGNPYTQYLINLKGLPDLPGCPEAGGSPVLSPSP